MKENFKNISMNGRMAYVIMIVEAFLKEKYPQRDWKILSEVMWKATEMNWSDWPELYSGYIPHVLYSYETYDSDLADSFSEETYHNLKKLYEGITSGREDDSEDLLDFMLNKPHEMAMVYEGTGIGDGHESIEIIEEAAAVLIKNKIALPDYHKVEFSKYSEARGWGENFDGRFLSVVLHE